MTTILVGSRAACIWYPDFREPHDTDFFTDEKFDKIKDVEVFWHGALYNWWNSGDSQKLNIATPDELYTIKVSHAFWPNRWRKHMADILFFQSKGCQVIPELYDLLYKVWVEHYGRKRARLNVKADEFFTATVDRKYDHDSIHASIAYHDEPLYKTILKDGEEVMVDKAKFDALSYEDKCNLVREEVYATALERFLIPNNYRPSQTGAYEHAMFKTVTSFSKGWFPYFIVTNYSDLHLPDVDYVARHKNNSDRLILL